MPNKFVGFDSVRGVAVLLVFVFHFYVMAKMTGFSVAGLDLSMIVQAGHIGLSMFFVLSGFLIFRSLYMHGVNWQYFKRRFLRITPIYYVAFAVCVIFLEPGLLVSWEGWWNILSHVFFIQSFDPQTYVGVNPVLWSLSVEMIFYLFLPLFFLVTKKRDWKMWAGFGLMILASFVFRYYISQYYGAWDSQQRIIYTENFIGRLDQFAVGMMGSFLVLKYGESRIFKWCSAPLMIAGILGAWWGMSVFAKLGGGFREVAFYQLFLHAIVGLATAAFLVGLAGAHKWVKMVIGNPVMEFVGLISYSFYIWHVVVTQQIIGLDMGLKMKFLVSFGAVLALSTITYFLVERPFLEKKRY